MYEITAKRKQARTLISLNSGPFPLKFSEILQAHSKNNRSLASGLTLILIPGYLTDFRYFSMIKKFRKLQDTFRTGQK